MNKTVKTLILWLLICFVCISCATRDRDTESVNRKDFSQIVSPPKMDDPASYLPSFCYQLDHSIFSKINPQDIIPRPDFPPIEAASRDRAALLPENLTLPPDKKLTYSVRNRLFGPWNKKLTGEIGLAIWFHPSATLSEAREIVEKYGGTYEGVVKLLNVVLTTVPEEKLNNFYEIRNEEAVRAIDIWPPRLQVSNDRVRKTAGVDRARAIYPNYDGRGVIAGVYDSAVVCQHPDFAGRLIIADDYNFYCGSHATHVAGTLGGSGAYSEEWGRSVGRDIQPFQFMGVAPGVQIVSYALGDCGEWGCLYNDPGDIEDDFGEMISLYDADMGGMSLGANVARNFLPCEWEGDMNLTSILIDTIVAGGLGREFIFTLSASNERSSYYGHRCGGGYGTLSPPAPAKNAIVVGASDEYYYPTDFTGFGPSDDGRIVITGCILGQDVWSTIEDWYGYGYEEMSGTSMSRPAMTGIAAIITQVFYEKYGKRPSPSLVKAIIVNNLEEAPGTPWGPDFMCGFGVMSEFSTLEAIETVREERFIEDDIRNGEEKNYLLVKLSSAQEVRVTLAWTDKPGSIERQELGLPQLINDLDLTVNGRKPLVPNPQNPSADAVETEDHLNNVEEVIISHSNTQCYIVKVKGYNVPQGPQKFSLAFSGAYAWPLEPNRNVLELKEMDKLKSGGKNYLPKDSSG